VADDDQPPPRPGHLRRRVDPDPPIHDPCGVDIDRVGGILDAAPGAQAVVVLVERRGDDALALHIADDSAGQDVRIARRVEVVEREDRVAATEDRYLTPVQQRADSGVGEDLLQLAERAPAHPSAPVRVRRSARVAGRIWPRSGTNTTLPSSASLL